MSEFVKTKKEFNKKPFNGNKDIKEGSEFILDIKRVNYAPIKPTDSRKAY